MLFGCGRQPYYGCGGVAAWLIYSELRNVGRGGRLRKRRRASRLIERTLPRRPRVADEVAEDDVGINQMCLRSRRHGQPPASQGREQTSTCRAWRTAEGNRLGVARSRPERAVG